MRATWNRTVASCMVAAALGLTGFAGRADAQDKANIEGAKHAFKAGQQFMQMQRFGDAVVEFKKAYAITKDGLVMGQIALAYEKAGDYEAALEAMQNYRSALPASDRASVDPLIEKYKKMIAEGRSKPLVLPGDEFKPAAAGAVGAQAAESGEEQVAEASAESAKRKGRLWTWIAAGTAGALGIAALVTGLSTKSKFDELNDQCGPGTGGVCSQGDVDGVDTRAVVTNVLWGTALAAGITATVLFFVEGRESAGAGVEEPIRHEDEPEEEETDDESEEEEDDDLVRSIRVAPLAGGGTFGLGAVFRY